MNARELIDLARSEGVIVERLSDDLVRVFGPKNEITDAIVKELRARKPEVLLALAPCCGQRHLAVAGEPLKLWCQLCPTSPSYHRKDQP